MAKRKYDLVVVPYIAFPGHTLYYFESLDGLNVIKQEQDESPGEAVANFMRSQHFYARLGTRRGTSFDKRIILAVELHMLRSFDRTQWLTLEMVWQLRLRRKDKLLMRYVERYLKDDGLIR